VGTSWFIPDDEHWHAEVDYNPAVARALECAAGKIYPGLVVDPEILDCIRDVLDAPMAKSQRLRILTILVACGAATEPPTAALPPLAEALHLARELDEIRAQIELLLMSAYINRYMSRIVDAVENLRERMIALDLLKKRGEWRPEDSIAALHTLLRIAQIEVNLGHIAIGWWWLDQAAALLAETGEHTDSQGRLAWIRALAYRWEGEYAAALAEAIAAVGAYRQLRDPEMLSRIEAATAEILLDLAEQSQARGDEAACATYLAQAELYIQRAIRVAFVSQFEASEAFARIVRARWCLLQGIPGDRKPLLEELARQAWRNQDMATVCMAYTVIGYECEAVFDLTSAKGWYQRAIAVVKELKIESVALWPKRALARLDHPQSPESPPPARPSA
jgi:hypothetical protein